ncbi:hypothetical protein LPJ55_000290 [Coemansia sp. RSA 990]|nr:hypothetical protein BX667DRAFT_36846 [Coemansia mojavensis]KAJ1743531.1 hypothetical protein LPJ68_000909 [Coemansia sp. RSA 1086]KAJ1753818.1 hypothetical protein LPJ79_000105 [Coemansia sp. RSA 1821]KAJ1875876.1 hypothetical protein LPJ55_000290 [Coemansia sp. RSA 990]KAJ2676909.1 hypothetical protein IWW42_000247 [Coemansia sp. RSA 1085]
MSMVISDDSGAAEFNATEQAAELVRRAGSLAAAQEEVQRLKAATEDEQRQELAGQQPVVLAQLQGTHMLDSRLDEVETQVREIRQRMHELRARVRVPYEQASEYNRQAENLQTAVLRVRGLSRVLQLERRLREQKDEALAALTLRDIKKAQDGLQGITVVDQALERVEQEWERILKSAKQMVDAGLRRQGGDVATGVQILATLDELPQVLHERVGYHLDAVHKTAQELGSSTGDVMWARVGAAADVLATGAQEMQMLERVLRRRRDLANVEIVATWWTKAADAIAEQIHSCAARGELVAGLPRLMQLLVARVLPPSRAAELGDRALQELAAEYKEQVAARLADAMDQCLPLPPQPHACAKFVHSVGIELDIARPTPSLHATVAEAAVTAARRLAAEARRAAPRAVDPLASSCKNTQSAVELIRSMEELRSGLSKFIELQPGVLAISGCIDALATLIIDACSFAVEAALLEGTWSSAEQALQWLHGQVLTRLSSPLRQELRKSVVTVISSTLGLFVHDACAVFPLSEEARLRLAGAAPQLELACNQLANSVGCQLSESVHQRHQSLRLLRPLLFMSADELCEVLQQRQTNEWQSVLLVDLLVHIICRVASADEEKYLPWKLLGCQSRHWRECLAAASNDSTATVESLFGEWTRGSAHGSCVAVLSESLRLLLANFDEETAASDLRSLLQLGLQMAESSS